MRPTKRQKEWDRRQESRHALQLMKRIMIHARGQMDELLMPQGVTTAQLVMLRAVRDLPGSSGAKLARECYVSPQSAQALLKQLEEGGFIVRGKDPENDRIVTATISVAGERLLASADKPATILLRRTWKGISDEELERLNALLEQCLDNIGGNGVRAE